MKNQIFSFPGVLTGITLLLTAILSSGADARPAIITNQPSAGLLKGLPGAAKEPGFKAVPSIIFKDGSGKTIDISKQKGKVLFINFWATWCLPCRAEMPSINKLKTEMKGMDILFLMVDVDNNYERARKFMDRKKYDLPVYTAAGDIPPGFLSRSIPATLIVDKQGRVVGRHEGPGNYKKPEVIKFFKDLANK
jgi:thiol-disulfide isomerase/thioredoxin